MSVIDFDRGYGPAVNRMLRAKGWYGPNGIGGGRLEPDMTQWLDLVALGTVCDVVSLTGVNRALVTQGLKVLELGLHFGGNDVGSVMLEENVVKAAGTSNCTTEEELRRIIRDAGFKPVQRDTLYRTLFLN